MANDKDINDDGEQKSFRPPSRAYSLGAYLLIVIIGLFGFQQLEEDDKKFAQADSEIKQQQRSIERSIACTEEFLVETNTVLEGRTGFATAVYITDRAQKVALRDYLVYVLKKLEDASRQESIRLLDDYLMKLQEHLKASDAAALDRQINKFPDSADYRRCLAAEEDR